MQIKTEVKATINQVKELIAEKYNISLDFDLEIVDETVQVGNFVVKQEDKPNEDLWYPDDSGEWVEVPDNLMEMPRELSSVKRVEYLLKYERDAKHWSSCEQNPDELDFNVNPHECNRIVAYKIVGE